MNRLANATSPYLLQHSANPVHWFPWSPAAFSAARKEQKPILLSIGYAACHWCHVMAHESFEDERTAAVMNALFVNIKVDREERPDIDHLYMSALHAMGEQGGWPLTMFLTAAGEPFWGGTYFPPQARYGKPAFADLLREVARIHREEPARVSHNSRALREHLLTIPKQAAPIALTADLCPRIAAKLAAAFDPRHGGIAGAPKFPNAPILDVLWRSADATEAPAIRDAFDRTIEQMIRGGIHDHLGGGFARYTVDEAWLIPHFEKMLYDNAQLLDLFALATSTRPDPLLTEAAAGIVTWLDRDMRLPTGLFAASLDADSEGEEGRYYVWNQEQIDAALGADAALFSSAYDVTPAGNWEGRAILNRLAKHDITDAERPRLLEARNRLLTIRAKRVPPALDDKALADWNGLTIAALTRAATAFHQPGWRELASSAYRAIMVTMRPDGELRHASRLGRHSGRALALDLAAMARAALALHEATGEGTFLADAIGFTDELERDFLDPDTGWLAMTAAGTADLIARPRPTIDDAVPNANGVYAEALVRLGMLTADSAYTRRADTLFAALAGPLATNPAAHASVLSALDLRLRGLTIVVAGPGGRSGELGRAALQLPHAIRTVLCAERMIDLPPGHPARQAGHAALPDHLAICTATACTPPITDAAFLREHAHSLRRVTQA